ncbi:MAG: phospholipase D-like domain-containing protein [Actinomycetes bacterium]
MRFPRGHVARLAFLCTAGLLAPLALIAGSPRPAEAAAPPAVRANLAGVPVWAQFTNPLVHEGRDRTIHNELVRLIDAAATGSTIRGTIHSLTVPPVARALLAAQERGVRVQVLIDGKNQALTNPAVQTIKQLQAAPFCTYDPIAYDKPNRAGNGCISTSDDGDLHVKMFLFTQTTDPTGAPRAHVSWFGSANMTYASGSDQFNNAITAYGDVALMTGLNRYFLDLWNRRHVPGNDYYDARARRGYFEGRAASVYASPEGAGQTDTVATRLNDLTPNSRCQLRIGMAFVTAARPALLRVVTGLRAKGCKVYLVVGSKRGGIDMDRGVYSSLVRAGVLVRRTSNVHDKFFLAYGKFEGRYQYRVYTGSQNWSGSALNTNDEIFVKMAPEEGTVHPLYDGFNRHFGDAWAAGRVCTTSNYPCR